MKLGPFDEQRAKDEAVSFLSSSIKILSSILGIDVVMFNAKLDNPYPADSPFHASYECLREEIVALRKILSE
jgi:hypothetical protein